MLRKMAVVVALVLPLAATVEAHAVGYTAVQRAAIRSMPIQQRPNRPGHFYGNSVRTLYRLGVIR
jgi:hypothetical protein